jgi:squalene cyclase
MSDLDRTIAEAAAFLVSARGEDGLWHDFLTLAGESCDWVSAYVACALSAAGVERDRVRDAGVALHYRQRPSGGWAYNEIVPPDCDSTAWVMLAMSNTTSWRPSSLIRASAYVLRHTMDRGFSTYAPEDGIGHFIEADESLTEGWRSPHLCVTAVVLQALLSFGMRDEPRLQTALTWLRGSQDEDGLWRSYWWEGPAYATLHALRALAAAGELTLEIWERARDGLLAARHADGGWGGAFTTSQALQALVLRPDRACDEAIETAADLLMTTGEGGRWAAVPILRIPPPMVPEPEEGRWREDALGTGVVIRDQHALFTTAAVLNALGSHRASS